MVQAGRCLAEIVAKLGERVMASILPVLEEGLNSEDAARRQGVCFGLGEVRGRKVALLLHQAGVITIAIARLTKVIGALPQRNGEMFLPQLAPPIRKALCDDSSGVRSAGAQVYWRAMHMHTS